MANVILLFTVKVNRPFFPGYIGGESLWVQDQQWSAKSLSVSSSTNKVFFLCRCGHERDQRHHPHNLVSIINLAIPRILMVIWCGYGLWETGTNIPLEMATTSWCDIFVARVTGVYIPPLKQPLEGPHARQLLIMSLTVDHFREPDVPGASHLFLRCHLCLSYYPVYFHGERERVSATPPRTLTSSGPPLSGSSTCRQLNGLLCATLSLIMIIYMLQSQLGNMSHSPWLVKSILWGTWHDQGSGPGGSPRVRVHYQNFGNLFPSGSLFKDPLWQWDIFSSGGVGGSYI